MFVRVVMSEFERRIPRALSSAAVPEIVPVFVRVVISELVKRLIPCPKLTVAEPEIVPVFVRFVIVVVPVTLIPRPVSVPVPAIVPSLSTVKLAPLFKTTAIVPSIVVPVGLLIFTLVSAAFTAGINPAEINAMDTAL